MESIVASERLGLPGFESSGDVRGVKTAGLESIIILMFVKRKEDVSERRRKWCGLRVDVDTALLAAYLLLLEVIHFVRKYVRGSALTRIVPTFHKGRALERIFQRLNGA
jgi:hypothetical protein